jgi:hypothetical protein
MNMPEYTAENSLSKTSEHYRLVTNRIVGTSGQGIIPQQDFMASTPWGRFFRCSPCVLGRQFCCPPPGVGLGCFVRRCYGPL